MAPLFGVVTYIIKELFLCLKVHPMGESKILQITYRLRLSAIFFYSHELFRLNYIGYLFIALLFILFAWLIVNKNVLVEFNTVLKASFGLRYTSYYLWAMVLSSI